MQFPSLFLSQRCTIPPTHLLAHSAFTGALWSRACVHAQAEGCNSGVTEDAQRVFTLENRFPVILCKQCHASTKSVHFLLHFCSFCMPALCRGAHEGKGKVCDCNKLSPITQQWPKSCGRSHGACALHHSVSDKGQQCSLQTCFPTYVYFHHVIGAAIFSWLMVMLGAC